MLMNATSACNLLSRFSVDKQGAAKEIFREKFQRSLRSCLQRGFSVEESFGMIWVETWEEVALSEEDQSRLYDELIGWAKNSVR